MERLFRAIVRRVQPHLSNIESFERKPKLHWSLDHTPRPSPKKLIYKRPNEEIITNIGTKYAGFDVRKPYRILCLDGGGVRGILTVALLERIVKAHPDFMDNVDFICGTSAGGILALLLAAGYSPTEGKDAYKFALPHIFANDPWRRLNPFVSKYDDTAKQELMQEYFGDRRMGDLEKTCAVVAFRLDGRKAKSHSFFNREGWRPAVFCNIPKGSGHVEPDSDLLVWEAVMRTSAAPTFFPIHKGYTDGGVVANNPSIIALAKAMAHYPNVTARNTVVLSLGAGNFPRHAKLIESAYRSSNSMIPSLNFTSRRVGYRDECSPALEKADWGIKQWIPFLLDILMDGDSVTTEMVMHYLLGNTGMYHRLDPRLPYQMALDDVSKVPDLLQVAENVDLTETLKFVQEKFMDVDLSSVDDNMGYNSLDNASIYHDAWQNLRYD